MTETPDSIPTEGATPAPEPAPTPSPAGWYPQPDGRQRYFDGVAWTENYAPGAVQQASAGHQIISDASGKPVQATLAWVIAVCTCGYMLPWAIAASRGKANAGAIGWLNLLLGWSVIGWIVALVMACGAHQKMAVSR